jgi:hypothetical protein
MFSLRALLQIGFIVLCVSVLGGGFLHQQLPVNAQMSPLTDRIEWTTIADSYYGYSFQIPAHWHKEMGVTPDRWTFYGELTFGKSQGFIKIELISKPGCPIVVYFVSGQPAWEGKADGVSGVDG